MENKFIKTKSFKIVTGVNEGYFHNNDNKKFDEKEEIENNEDYPTELEKISSLWSSIAKEVQKQTSVYISAVITPSKTVYANEWGCPYGGEDTYSITGVANPEFIKNLDEWVRAIYCCAFALKEELKQSTITIEIQDSSLLYIK